MTKTIVLTLLALLISGCGKSVSRDEQNKNTPGYQEAKNFCSQCHSLPFGDQHPPAAWPDVVARMEGYIQTQKRKMPSQAEHDAIVNFFQNDK